MRSWWDLGEHAGQIGDSLSLDQIGCAFCEEVGNFKLEHHAEKKKSNGGKVLNFDTYKCGNCFGYVMVLWSATEHGGSRDLYAYRVLPFPLKISRAPDYMPVGVGRSWLQVQKSLASESWDAVAIMARTAMESALSEQKAQGQKLIQKIEDLASKGILPPLMKEWAHEVRLLGNEGAHSDPLSAGVNQEDANDIAEFLDYLLEYLFDLPKRITVFRSRKKQ